MASDPERRVPRPGGLIYRVIRGFTLSVAAVFTRAHVVGGHHVPRSGGLLIVSNHLSIADPVILMAFSPRAVVFMAKEELFRPWHTRMGLRLWGGAFAVRRGEQDIRAVRDALELIRAGVAVVVFPEGTRRPAGLGEPQPGVGYLAARAGCPVVPVGIIGTEEIRSLWSLWRRPAFEVRFGEPFTISEPGKPDEIAAVVMERVAALLPPERRGVYAGERVLAHA
jgi:1-acyl-sn-glycerol-3-phosphate acyltransferase